MREPLSDELFEVVLKQAVYDADKADLEELPSDEEMNQAYPLPEKAHKEFDRLQKAQTRGISMRTMIARRVAIITITALAVVFGGLMLHPDIRAGVSHIVVQQFEKFNLFHHDENGEVKHYLTVDDVIIGYIPEGFELTNEIVNETRRTYCYVKGENDFILSIVLSAWTDVGVDNEHDYEIRYINHRELHISYDNKTQSGAIVIPDETVTITISGNIAKDELVRIAENIS
jgi:hypothetical protein